MKKIILSVICLILACCLGFAGCASGSSRNPINPVDTQQKGDVSGTVHEYTVTDTGKNIIANGASDYKILIPADQSTYIGTASLELQTLLKEATGVTLAVQEEDGVAPSGKFISLGNTLLANDNSVSSDYATVGEQGFNITTKGDNIFITAARDIGVLWGVYGYLEQELNFDFYYDGVYDLDKVTELPLRNYTATDVPDISYRSGGYYTSVKNTTSKNRMRYVSYDPDVLIPVGGLWIHNSLKYLPFEQYGTEHSEWYMDSKGSELCYTAHGRDTESYQEMTDTVVQVMFDSFTNEAYLNYNAIAITIMDHSLFCSCPACNAIIEKYGANSATIILFCNDVAEKLEARLREIGDARADTFQIVFFAYHETTEAPVDTVTDPETGEVSYSYDPAMKCNPHVGVFYAPIRANYTASYYTSMSNATYRNLMGAWSEICDFVYFWAYDTYFKNYLIPYNSFNAISDLYKFAYESKVDLMFCQGQTGQTTAATGWALLRDYLASKLGWNVNEDVDALIEKFFNAMYGAESKTMLTIFNEYRALARWQIEEKGYITDIGSATGVSAEFWPKNVLADWTERMYRAIDNLNALGDTASADHVRIEQISDLYLYLTLYGNTGDMQTTNRYKNDFAQSINDFSITKARENGDIADVLSEFGLK